jgi:VWFA-related protein
MDLAHLRDAVGVDTDADGVVSDVIFPLRRAASGPVAGSDAAATFRTGANYVRADVYATQNGNPVTDLRQDEFSVLEDGKRQQVGRFEFINIRDGALAPFFLEPATVSAARRPNTDGRTRLFVLFLDRPHVDDKGSATIREPLLNMLRRTISDRDLVAVMTPDMTVTELTFSTRTTALERFIERDRFWGERSRLAGVDPFETELKRCYPYSPDLVEELIARRRETRTMDAVQSLVEYLGNLRDERKAILLFSSGWLRFEPTGSSPISEGGRRSCRRQPGHSRVEVPAAM